MKLGRPSGGNEAETVKTIHVALDAEAAAALEQLKASLGAGIGHGRTSIAVRKALHKAAEALRGN